MAQAATPAPPGTPVPTTSLAEHDPAPDEVTVQFRRWQAYGPTAYQRGQQAGFTPREAEELRRLGHVIVHDRAMVRADGPPMVRK